MNGRPLTRAEVDVLEARTKRGWGLDDQQILNLIATLHHVEGQLDAEREQ